MSLRWRLAIAVTACVAIAVGAVAFVAHLTSERQLRDGIDEFLVEQADAVGDAVQESDIRGGGRRPGPDPVFVISDAVVQLIDRDGRITDRVEGRPELPVDPIDRRLADDGGRAALRTVTVDGADYRMITRPVRGGAVQIARDLSEIDDALAGIDRRLLAVGLVGIGAAALVGWSVARGTVRPVERLAGRAEYVASTQDLDAAIDVDRSDELGRLATSFNTMLGALRLSREQQSRLVHDASHELRTPLTSVRTNIEVLRRRIDEVDIAQRDQILADLDVEAAELSDLVAELVDLATDTDVADEPVVQLRLPELVEGVADRFRRRSGRSVAVHVSPDDRVVVGVTGRIERAVTNLIGNAVKFSPAGSPIDVTVDGPRVEVRDQGPGIPTEDLALVFDRFHRAVATRDQPGSGLGLAIVQQVVHQQGGRVWARNLPDGGAGVGFELATPPA